MYLCFLNLTHPYGIRLLIQDPNIIRAIAAKISSPRIRQTTKPMPNMNPSAMLKDIYLLLLSNV